MGNTSNIGFIEQREHFSYQTFWTSKRGIGQVQYLPNFFKKRMNFYTIRNIIIGMSRPNDCILSFTFQIDLLLKKYVYFKHFLFFKVDINQHTIQKSMWHSVDKAVHKIKRHSRDISTVSKVKKHKYIHWWNSKSQIKKKVTVGFSDISQ